MYIIVETKKLKNERTSQRGGNGRVIPKYTGDRNNPFKSNEETNIGKQRYNETNRTAVKQPEPLLEFKLNNVTKQPMPQNQGMYPSAYIPIQNAYMPDGYPYVAGGGMQNQYPYSFTPNNVPVIKNYNISLPNPSGDHVKIADLYEDMLPNTGKYNNTSITLEERLIIYNYVRQVLVRIGDGEDIDIDGNIKETTNRKNLLSYLKLLDLNPYHNSRLTPNPYLSLPKKMLMYRSCYPIRFDAATKKTTCSKFSIGLNLRIYQMTEAEYNIKHLPPPGAGVNNHAQFNLWREVAFYEFVKENILKKKICPNFPIIYSWFISGGTDIDFKRLQTLQNKYGQVDGNGKPLYNADEVAKNKAHQLAYKKELDEHFANKERIVPLSMTGGPYHFNIYGILLDQWNMPVPDRAPDPSKNDLGFKNRQFTPIEQQTIKFNLSSSPDGKVNLVLNDINKPIDRSLLILTEAPNYNIIQWATRTYNNQILGPIKTMIQTGYHPENVWLSILFQLLIALHVMYLKKITFFKMTLEDNIYIKDLMNNEQTVGYWKYIVNDLEFYIPNHGFLLLIDSNFKDIESNATTVWSVPEDERNKEVFKSYGDVDPNYNDDQAVYRDKLNQVQYENLIEILDPDKFRNAFTLSGGIKPPDNVMMKIRAIYTDISNRVAPEAGAAGVPQNGDLSEIIFEHMGGFLHNRAGTFLSKTEQDDGIGLAPQHLNINNAKPGHLYPVHEGGNYKWVIYKGLHRDRRNQIEVYTRTDHNSPDIILGTYYEDDLFIYNSLQNIDQKFKAQEGKLGEDELLETYRIN